MRALAVVAACLAAQAGCGRHTRGAVPDVPPGLEVRPGVVRDVAPRWSPDGLHIAFLRCTPDRRVQLCISTRDLGGVTAVLAPALVTPDRPLRTGRAASRAPEVPAWSSDGRYIAAQMVEWFTFDDGDRMPGTGLLRVEVSSRATEPLLTHPPRYTEDLYAYRSPAWSPGGRYVAATAEGIEGPSRLVWRPLPGGLPEADARAVPPYDDADWPAWSPDGRRLAFRCGVQRALSSDPVESIRVIEPGGRTSRTVFRLPAGRWQEVGQGRIALAGPPRLAAGAVRPRAAGLAWSPDGRRLAFSLSAGATASGEGGLWVTPADGASDALRVTPPGDFRYAAPVWVDASRLGALRRAEGGWDVVEVQVGGGPVRVLCRVPSDDVDWSPDRRAVVCSVPRAGGGAGLEVVATGLQAE